VFGAPRDFEDGETIESRYDRDVTPTLLGSVSS
jgi:hypothetical protein